MSPRFRNDDLQFFGREIKLLAKSFADEFQFFLGDIVVAICGAFAGHFLFGLLNIQLGGGYLGLFISATVGAVVLLLLIRLIKRI